ncbi:hypothetical protein ACFW9O_11925 [Streptomyces sp. NPDC059499]|uniref:hypothetical protein n=1 Tax=Streptomyces sp. NPDC059499 TaxID=3346852 RepID=UPI003694A7FB
MTGQRLLGPPPGGAGLGRRDVAPTVLSGPIPRLPPCGRCGCGVRAGRRTMAAVSGPKAPYAQAAAAVGPNGVNVQRTNTVASTSMTAAGTASS